MIYDFGAQCEYLRIMTVSPSLPAAEKEEADENQQEENGGEGEGKTAESKEGEGGIKKVGS